MTEVASRELRNNTRQLLDRVASGELITVTVNGRAVAQLTPVETRQTWMPRRRLLSLLENRQADPAMADELKELAPDSTDDIEW